jgi:hypothetical protein
MSASMEDAVQTKELHVCYDYCAAWKETTPE